MSEVTGTGSTADSAGQLVEAVQHAIDVSVEGSNDTLDKYLTFDIAGNIFGTNIEFVNEIIEHGRFTRVPLSQSNIRGVINLRGHVVPVVDLAKRLGFESQAVNKRTCIIIVDMEDDGEKIDLGFVVDAVDEVIDIDSANIEAAPGFGLEVRQDFIEGMGKLQNGDFVKLLDLKTVLSVNELSGIKSGGQSDA